MPINSSADLLNLLSTCEPDNEPLEMEAQIETLVSMPIYKELSESTEFAKEFRQYYAPNVLRKLSLGRVRKARGAIAVVPECLRAIRRSITDGPAPALTKEDFPDFYSAVSLRSLTERLTATTSKNYTNIPQEDCMEIFSDETIKDVRSLFGAFDEKATDLASEIDRVAAGRPYCISEEDVRKVVDEYDDVMFYLETEGVPSTDGWLGSRVHRIELAVAMFVAATLVCIFSPSPSTLVSSFCISLSAVVSVLFCAWG